MIYYACAKKSANDNTRINIGKFKNIKDVAVAVTKYLEKISTLGSLIEPKDIRFKHETAKDVFISHRAFQWPVARFSYQNGKLIDSKLGGW